MISFWYRFWTITIDEGTLSGRTFWGRKNQIPLKDITELTPESCSGIDAIIVHSNSHGQIYIAAHTERFDELMKILENHLPEELDNE